MTKPVTTALTCAVAVMAISTAAIAANRKVQRMVDGLTKDQAALLSKFPSLSRIDSEIRADCSAKNAGHPPEGEFCGCAAALTVGLWRSGVDPKMGPRLTEYLKAPTATGAKEFLQYQGPELYRPLCTEALKK